VASAKHAAGREDSDIHPQSGSENQFAFHGPGCSMKDNDWPSREELLAEISREEQRFPS
jgi:hypothetical protein